MATNYRPISVLPSLSKITESILYDRLISFFEKNKIINSNQFGFQKKSGTLSATTMLVDLIQTRLDAEKNMIACCVFIDLKKAFDTVPHSRLMNKLYRYGIRGKVNELLTSYLGHRVQIVDINNTTSDNVTNDNEFGLPQGSNLGPFLFLVYINGIFDIKIKGILILFADDAVLILFDDNIDNLKRNVQGDIDAIASWLSSNKLTLNSKKTKCMLIKYHQTTTNTQEFKITIDGNIIERVSSFKYLGITIQENLKWNMHVDNICGKLAGLSSVVKRLGNKIHTKTLISFYHSMVNSHISYLAPVWGTSAGQGNIERLQIAQNNAIRKLFHYDYNTLNMSTDDIRKKYNILNVAQTIRFNGIQMMYKIDNNLIKTSHTMNRERAHNYNTRNRNNPIAPSSRTMTGDKNIYRACTQQYAATSPSITRKNTLNSFKKALKKKIIDSHT